MIPYSIHSMTLAFPTHSLVYDSFWTHGRENGEGGERTWTAEGEDKGACPELICKGYS